MIFGIGKPVVKAHGNSDGYAFSSAISQLRTMVKADLINKVVELLPENKREENE